VERLAAVCPGLRELRGNSVTFGGGCGEALAELTCLTALHLPWVTTKDMPDAGYVGGLARLPRLHTLEVSHSRAVGLAAWCVFCCSYCRWCTSALHFRCRFPRHCHGSMCCTLPGIHMQLRGAHTSPCAAGC